MGGVYRIPWRRRAQYKRAWVGGKPTAPPVNAAAPFASGVADANTVLLLHADGAAASTYFPDSSPSPHAVTAGGNAQVDMAQSEFGGAAALFDGSTSYLSVADSADWAFGAGDFTIDFWVRFANTTGDQYLVSQIKADNTDRSFAVLKTSGGSVQVAYSSNGSSWVSTPSFAWAPAADTWYHVAVVRSGVDLKVFVNGVQAGATHNIAAAVLFDSSRPLMVGAQDAASNFLNGWLDEVRVSKGVARWTTGFTPPTAPYAMQPVVGETVVTSSGVWAGYPAPTFAYQWQRDGHGDGVFSNIAAATSASYVLVDADDLCQVRCVVTATNAGGSASANSNALGPVTEPAPVNTAAPVASGTPAAGDTLSVTTGTWLHMGGWLPTYQYQWQRDCGSGYVNVPAATFPTYVVAPGDVGCNLRAVVSASNSGGETPQTSNALGPATGPVPANVVAPTITGQPWVLYTLCADEGEWTGMDAPDAFFTYQWQQTCATPDGTYPGATTFPGASTFPGGGIGWCDIVGETGRCFTPDASFLGATVRVLVTAHNSQGTAEAASPGVTLGKAPAAFPVTRRSTIGTVGCGGYQVLAMERGGRRLVAELPATAVTWARVLDDTSGATATLRVSHDCRVAVAQLNTWQHEIAIVRDGDAVWAGPILFLSLPWANPEIRARDVSAWWDHRRIHEDHELPDTTDVALAFAELVRDAMAPDNSPRVDVVAEPSGVLGAVTVNTEAREIAGARLRQLTDVGVDWTVVVRRVLCGGLTVPAGSLGVVTDDWFTEPPTVDIDGSNQENASDVVGQSEAADGLTQMTLVGSFTDDEARARDGLLESVTTMPDASTQSTVDAAARSNAQLGAAPAQVTPAVLSPYAPVTVQQLIPGAVARLELAATFRPVSGWYRLKQVEGAADATSEKITLTFQPLGTQ